MKRAIIITLLLFAILNLFLTSFYLDYYTRTSDSQPAIFYLPEARYIKPIVLGYDNLAADIIWIKTISYFADQFTSGRDYKYLKKLLNIIVDLDPMFEKAVIWGGSVLLYNGNWITPERIVDSNRFLEYAWSKIKSSEVPYRHDQEYWRIPHMIGFNYAIELKDPKRGVPFIEEVAKIEGSPVYYRTWVSTLYNKAGEKDKAMHALERQLIVENLRTALMQNIDEDLRNKIIARLKKFYSDNLKGKDADEKIDALNRKVGMLRELYSTAYPYLPASFFVLMNPEENLLFYKDRTALRLFYGGR